MCVRLVIPDRPTGKLHRRLSLAVTNRTSGIRNHAYRRAVNRNVKIIRVLCVTGNQVYWKLMFTS